MAIVSAIAFYFYDPSRFSAASIAEFARSFNTAIWLVYLLLSAIRGFTLLPSTPLVLAGNILYPDSPWVVLTISMSGILISSSLIYFFSETLGFAEYFERRNPAALVRIRRRLEHPSGLAFVALWAFFPLVPTDAVCYVAGTTKMSFPRFIAAVFLGELVLCSIYIFTGRALFRIFV
jgi:uncharacterized membrane protein YdjX (TVP38/TMEM64 family)